MSEVENLLSMAKRACFEADMLPGSNIFDLPNMVKKLRKERDYYKERYEHLQNTLYEKFLKEEINRGGW